MRFRSLALFALAVSIAACDSTGVNEPLLPPQALPLAVGAEWTLQQTYAVQYDMEGVPGDTLDQRSRDRTYTISVDRDSTIEGDTWYRLGVSRGLLHCVFEEGVWLANRPDGLYRFRDSVDDAERVYATGIEAGVPFVDTPELLAVLEGESVKRDVSGNSLRLRRYVRTWRGANAYWGQGPISPSVMTRDDLSPERGVVALEVAFVRQGATENTFVPQSIYGYQLIRSRTGSDAIAVQVDRPAGQPVGVGNAELRD